MKNRGKNKKKQWKRILKNISSDLHDAVRENNLTAAGFEVQKPKECSILKGDKDLAKDCPDIPTASSALERKSYKKGKRSIFARMVDVWDDDFEVQKKASNTVEKARKVAVQKVPEPTLIVPAGQSYNPTLADHQALLMHVAKEEEEKAVAAADPDAVKEARKKHPKKKKLKPTQAQLDAIRHEEKVKEKKSTAAYLAKQMHNDLENIPKLVKEIKKEKKELEVKKAKKQVRKAIKKYEKLSKFPLSFQLPGELAPSLRKLRTDPNWMREVEFKRNKLPRARRTLDRKADSKIYERRSRKDAP
ncbi:unnamed protein product [Rodentolepis nana]|uniref:Ribosome biogenesis protein NOP53 n=1 Tax=Rodentolepis nana TaxID=102285 RepID=A0A158QI11_RODNA|nr:unnamed protein product [Rodentolepis nana]